MTLWFAIALLVAVALAFVLPPLLREGGRRAIAAVAVAVPLATAGLYAFLGAPEILEAQALVEAQGHRDADAMLAALERKLAREPDDAEGWYAMGRAYIAMQRLADAEAALARAAKLAPRDARILAQYAEALALGSGSLEGRPLQLVQQALELNYEEEKALELAGLAAFQRQEWAQSLHYWRRLLKRLPRESEYYEGIAQGVKLAEQKVIEASGLGERARLQAPEKRKEAH
jgi:cytochrome c-type biogenesis protein CcmH